MNRTTTLNSPRSANLPAPTIRPRRLRVTATMRDLAAETTVRASSLIQPHFIVPGRAIRTPILTMPGIDHVSPDVLVDDVAQGLEVGLRAVLLFGVPDSKDAEGDSAADPAGPVCEAVQLLKKRFGDEILVMTDVCLCAYTDHGHCGVLRPDGGIDNDASLPVLARMAVAHAQAGADWVCPSDMMDGRVAAIRRALDDAGHTGTAILSYAVKYASAYYGPFRDAAHSAPQKGDRKSYQMDPRNVREALREVALDEAEGADAVMVKPALAYLDIIRAVRNATTLPLACYNVSGEYAMVKAAAAQGLLNEAAIVRENLTAMTRAGADWIITYHAREALREGWL
ncbi:MAG: porphobilinogen synthase [Thermoplasmatota archaeon]